MNDEFYRPTYTSDSSYGAFNATQVRLYGIPGQTNDTKTTSSEMHAVTGPGGFLVLRLNSKDKYPIKDDEAGYEPGKDDGSGKHGEPHDNRRKSVVDALNGTLKDRNVSAFLGGAALETSMYSHVFVDAIMRGYLIMVSAIQTSITKIKPAGARDAEDEGEGDDDEDNDQCATTEFTTGIIFGYAYEGHTYQLPKPKVMLIPAKPKLIPADDSGYQLKEKAGYRVWLVDKLDQCVEIEINQGFIEQLVLDANLPGKRSPTMYAGRMMMAHRSGRMTE